MFERIITDLATMGSILVPLLIFLYWVFNQRFVTKAELKTIERELHSQDKAITTLSTKMDNVINSVNGLTNAVNDIKDFLINNSKRSKK